MTGSLSKGVHPSHVIVSSSNTGTTGSVKRGMTGSVVSSSKMGMMGSASIGNVSESISRIDDQSSELWGNCSIVVGFSSTISEMGWIAGGGEMSMCSMSGTIGSMSIGNTIASYSSIMSFEGNSSVFCFPPVKCTCLSISYAP